jgi:hypothetical protein
VVTAPHLTIAVDPFRAYHADVSVPVALDRLRQAIADTDRAPYLVTVADDGRPHSVAVAFEWRGNDIVLAIGNHTLANASARPLVTLLWPPLDPTGYTLIVDATLTGTAGGSPGGNTMTVRPTRAVLHRPAVGSPPKPGCTADCVPLEA